MPKYLRENHSPFVTEELSKAITLRSNLRNQYLKCKSDKRRTHFKIHRNHCVTLLRKAKLRFRQGQLLKEILGYSKTGLRKKSNNTEQYYFD